MSEENQTGETAVKVKRGRGATIARWGVAKAIQPLLGSADEPKLFKSPEDAGAALQKYLEDTNTADVETAYVFRRFAIKTKVTARLV